MASFLTIQNATVNQVQQKTSAKGNVYFTVMMDIPSETRNGVIQESAMFSVMDASAVQQGSIINATLKVNFKLETSAKGNLYTQYQMGLLENVQVVGQAQPAFQQQPQMQQPVAVQPMQAQQPMQQQAAPQQMAPAPMQPQSAPVQQIPDVPF